MHIRQLGLGPAAHSYLNSAGIRTVEQLTTTTATELLDQGVKAQALYEIVCRLNDAGYSLPAIRGGRIRPAKPRELEILRLRLIERRTLKEIGQQVGVGTERVRQLLNQHFGLTGTRR